MKLNAIQIALIQSLQREEITLLREAINVWGMTSGETPSNAALFIKQANMYREQIKKIESEGIEK